MTELPGLDHDHPSRKPQWGASIYNPPPKDTCGGYLYDGRKAAKGAHPPASTCPCGHTFNSVTGHPECANCETWRCPRCERWCSWEMGHDDCKLCDDCCVYLDACGSG